MKLMYPAGYIFLFFFCPYLYADKIAQYYQLYQGLQNYQQLLIEKYKDKDLQQTIACSFEQVEMSVKATSNFATSCVMLTTLSKQPNTLAQGNIILQALFTAYAMYASFSEIIKHKKEQKKMVENMTYLDMVTRFPQIVLIDYQLKIIKLLLQMHSSQDVSERAFARIHLVTMILPKPYESMSKKIARKIYKKYFNELGDLISLQEYEEEQSCLGKFLCNEDKFLKNISIDWHILLFKISKISTDFSLFSASEYTQVSLSSINQKILAMIEASRNKDLEKLYELKPNILEVTLVELYDFLIKQIER